MNPVTRWRIRRRLKRIDRLKARASQQFDQLPTRQLRRHAARRAVKVLGHRDPKVP